VLGTALIAEKFLGKKQEFFLNKLMQLAANRRIKEEIKRADVLMLGAPWLFDWLRRQAPHKPILFLTSDLAYNFYKTLLPPSTLKQVFAYERTACTQAYRTYVCTEKERTEFAKLYGVPLQKVLLLPNGVNRAQYADLRNANKPALKQSLGIDGKKLCVYVGGKHIPAQTAVKMLLEIAKQLPDVRFAVIGGAGDGFRNTANVSFLGHVRDTEKRRWLAAADIALNPTTIGPGSNVKLFEYLAAGLLTVSTTYGLRGSTFAPGKQVAVADSVSDFAQTIKRLLANPALSKRIAAAGYSAAQKYDWVALARIIEHDLQDLKQRAH
jgi:glycosyltransferase involved in cell wall biosynthesis